MLVEGGPEGKRRAEMHICESSAGGSAPGTGHRGPRSGGHA